MAVMLVPTETVSFAPDGPESAISYRLRVPTVYDRVRLRRALAARGALYWSEIELVQACRRAVNELLAAAEDEALRARFTAALDEYQGCVIAAAPVPEDLAALVVEIEAICARGHHEVAIKRADNLFWTGLLPIEAARLLVVGWDGIAAECRVGPDGLSAAALAAMPAGHAEACGWHGLGLMRVEAEERKN